MANLEDPAHPQASPPGANLEDVPTMDEILEQTAAAILSLDPDYSTQDEIETARRGALAALSQTGGDSVAVEMVERAAALLLGGMGGSSGSADTESASIDEQVSIGNYSLASNLDKLQTLGVTAVVSVDAARPPLFGESLKLLPPAFRRFRCVLTQLWVCRAGDGGPACASHQVGGPIGASGRGLAPDGSAGGPRRNLRLHRRREQGGGVPGAGKCTPTIPTAARFQGVSLRGWL